MKGPTIHSFEIHRGRHGSTTHNTPLMQVRFVSSTPVLRSRQSIDTVDTLLVTRRQGDSGCFQNDHL
jgi:hypothetical protein